MAESRADAEKAFNRFLAKYRAKYDKAADCLAKDREALLMVGFPILVLKETKSDGASATKIAPVLLWPLRISIQAGPTGSVKLGFDTEREVQLNPGFNSVFGAEVCARWQNLADDLLQGGALKAEDVLRAFEEVAPPPGWHHHHRCYSQRESSEQAGTAAASHGGGAVSC